MTDFQQLLVVQDHDTALAQLQHRRATLPEREQADALGAALDTLASQRQAVQTQLDAVRLDQSRLEDKAQMLQTKREREQAKLYSGSVTAIKELQALEEEIASLERQQAATEDEVLTFMEQAEPLVSQIAAIDAKVGEVIAKRDSALSEIARQEGEIDAEMSAESTRRDEAAQVVPTELLTHYEGIRSDAGGVGVARFSGSRCEGCHLKLSAVEADKIKRAPADEIVTCGSCGRILVR